MNDVHLCCSLQRHHSNEIEEVDKVGQVQNQVDELKGIMVRNIGQFM